MTYQADTNYVAGTAPRDLDEPRLYSGVRTRRIVGFLFDYALVLVLSIPAAIVVFFLGLVSLGLAWGLYAVLLPVIAIV